MTKPFILIVSADNKLSARVSDVLIREGYNVFAEKNVEGCFARLGEGKVGTVVVDADLRDDGPTRILEKLGTLWANVPVVLLASENTIEETMRKTGFAALDYITKECGELSLRYRVTKAYQQYEDSLATDKSGGPAFRKLQSDLQQSIDELSCLYNICQVIGRDTPIERCLRSITRLLARGMRSSTSTVAEIWLDGERYSEFPELPARTCELSAPVVVGEAERGKLVVYSCQALSFSPREVAMVTNVARKVGYTVRRSELRRALAVSETKHRRLLEAVTEGVFWAHFEDRKGITWVNGSDKEAIFDECLHNLKVTDCNLAFASFYGFASVKECIGTSLGAFFKDAAVARRYFERLFNRGCVSQLTKRKAADGSERLIEMVSHVIRRAGNIIGIQGINLDGVSILGARDLSKSQKQRFNLDLLGHLFGECRYGVIVADLLGHIVYANPFLIETLGLQNGEGLMDADLSILYVEGQGDLERDVETQTLSDGSWAGELQRYGPKNEPITTQLVTSLIRDESGEPIAQLHIYSDITEQKERQLKLESDAEDLHRAVEERTRELVRSEENRRRAYHLAPIGIAITTISGGLTDANDELSEMLKYSREELLDRNLASMCSKKEEYEQLLSETMSNGKVLDQEVGYLAKDGAVVVVEQSSVMMEGDEGETFITHFFKDVTESKKMAMEAEERQRQIIRADKLASLGQLVAGVAHELNNPLTAVLTYGHLLRRKTQRDDKRRESLDNIIEAGERCRNIVKKLLDFAHERESAKTSANLNEVVQHVLDILRNQMLIRKVKVVTNLSDELPQAWVDPHEMEQVFLNICVNAVEVTKGGGQLIITSEYDMEKDVITLKFEDTGSGISPENLEKIFEPFFTTKEVGKGTGLGLAVSQRIVSNHNGTISVESVLGEGSTFSVQLPVSSHVSEES